MPTLVQNIILADQRAATWLSAPFQARRAKARAALRLITHLGDGHLWVVLGFALAFTQGRQGWIALGVGAMACLGSLALFKVVKNGVARPRPDASLVSASRLLVPLDQYSFPSGHSATSLS